MGVVTDRADQRFVADATRQFEASLGRLVQAYRLSGRSATALLGDPAALAERALVALAPLPSPWDELVGPFVRSEGVQARLAITRQAVAAKAARRRLLRTITSDGQHLYPVWQFEGDGVVAGLAEVLSLFPESLVDGWTLAGWLRSPDPDLGAVPIDALRRGRAIEVLAVARDAARALAG
ncbi:MAG: hypothetical protein ACKV2O_24605 [Acidimicrobiales bacterium]